MVDTNSLLAGVLYQWVLWWSLGERMNRKVLVIEKWLVMKLKARRRAGLCYV
jgi:hypothetical protein